MPTPKQVANLKAAFSEHDIPWPTRSAPTKPYSEGPMSSVTITYSIGLEHRGYGYYVVARIGGDAVYEVGPIEKRDAAYRIVDSTALRLRASLKEAKARIVRHLTATKAF